MVTQGKSIPLLLPSCLVHSATREVRLPAATLQMRRPRWKAAMPARGPVAGAAGLCAHTRLTSSPLHVPLYPWLLIKAIPVSQNQKEAPLCYFRLKMESTMS